MIHITYLCHTLTMEKSDSPTRPPKKRRRVSNNEFDERFGDLSPLPEFKGPKVPSVRQSLGMFIHHFKSPVDKDEAVRLTIANVLKQHADNPETKLQPRYLEARLKEKYEHLK